jgi:hypothetical protein
VKCRQEDEDDVVVHVDEALLQQQIELQQIQVLEINDQTETETETALTVIQKTILILLTKRVMKTIKTQKKIVKTSLLMKPNHEKKVMVQMSWNETSKMNYDDLETDLNLIVQIMKTQMELCVSRYCHFECCPKRQLPNDELILSKTDL